MSELPPPLKHRALVGGVDRALGRVPATTRQQVQLYSRRSASAAGLCFAVVLAFGVVALGMLYARLAQGPLALPFLVGAVEQAVNAELTGVRFNVGGVVLQRSKLLGLKVRLRDVTLRNEIGDVVARSPEAAIGLSDSALLRAALRPEKIELIGVRLSLQHDDARGLTLAVAGGTAARAGIDADDDDDDGTQTVLKSPVQQAAPRQAETPGDGSVRRAPPPAEITADAPSEPLLEPRRFDLAGTMAALFDRMAQGGTADLATIALTRAEIAFDDGDGDGVRIFAVPQATIDLRSSGDKRSIRGRGTVAAGEDRFDVEFKTAQARQGGRITLEAKTTEVVPRRLAGGVNGLASLRSLDMPAAATLSLSLTENGDILALGGELRLGAGRIVGAPDAEPDPEADIAIESAALALEYDRDAGRVTLSRAALAWPGGQLALSGEASASGATESGRLWDWQLRSAESHSAVPEFDVPDGPLELTGRGRYAAAEGGTLTLEQFAAGAPGEPAVTLAGTVTRLLTRPDIALDGSFGKVSVEAVKRAWPKTLAGGARLWVGEKISAGRIAGGTLRIRLDSETLAALSAGGDIPAEAVAVRLDLADLAAGYITGLPPMVIPASIASFTGRRFAFDVPAATIAVKGSPPLTLSGAQFLIGDLRPEKPTGELHFKATGPAATALALLDHPPLSLISGLGVGAPQASGDLSGAFSVTVPLLKHLTFRDMKLAGRARVAGVKAAGLPGGFAVQGGALALDVNESAIDATGEVTMSGVPVKLAWQRIFDAEPNRQPPLRISAAPDEAQRSALGLGGLAHVVRGRTPFELTVALREQGDPAVHLEADLSGAEVFLAAVGWSKVAGDRAVLGFDIVPEGAGTKLANFVVTGNRIDLRGEVSLNEARKPSAFRFPTFGLNELTRMEVSGALAANVWKVKASGDSYDGRQFFSALFSAGQLAEDQPASPKGSAGLDLAVDIGQVFGHNDVSLRNVNISAKRRGDKLTALDVAARIDGNALLVARVETKDGARILGAQAADAGAAFRMVGLYQQVRGGSLALQVNLDGSGAAEKTGILYASNFTVVDDAVVGEVLAGGERSAVQAQGAARARAGAGGAAAAGQRRRGSGGGGGAAPIQFDRMRVPFSVGHGQLVLHDSAINGPLIGATMRGRIDFGRRNLALSGTYVPMYGLNAAFSGIPILGDLLSGRRGEGIFGITFAVQGAMANPNVLVNPISMVAPGFLRQIFEFDHTVPQVIAPPGAGAGGNGAGAGQRSGTGSGSQPAAPARRPATTGDARNEERTFTR